MKSDGVEYLTARKTPHATELVSSWILETWGDPRGEGREELRQRLAGRRGNPEAMVAVVEGRPVGVVAFRRYPLAPDNVEALWIDALYVLPDHRGQGIGSQLIAIAEDIAARSDERLHAFTDVPGLYEKHGWQRLSQDP